MEKETDIFDKRLIILFLLKETDNNLTIEQITSLCGDFEDITYIDIYSYIESLLKAKYIIKKIQDDKIYYQITEDGLNILNELLVLVPGANWLSIKKIIKEQIENYNKNYEIGTKVLMGKGNDLKVSCYIKDNSDELINLTLFAGDTKNAKKISDKWNANADDIYKKIIELMS